MSYMLQNKTVRCPLTGAVHGTGWLPPMIDRRDYTEDHPGIAVLASKLRLAAPKKSGLAAPLPATVDLRALCSPIENQGGLGSCTANAAAGVVEYSENRAFGKYLNGSRLFIYKNSRNIMGVTGDTGAWLRNTMGSLVLCGVAEERYWPYTDASPAFDAVPPAFVYAIADNYEALKYFCHDPLGGNVAFPAVLASVKKYLTAGVPSMLGFWGFGSSGSGDVPGSFPLPGPGEQIQWGHAVVAVGYDNNLKITNQQYPAVTSKGALLIRNSWGTGFGTQGYGWIPYDYVLKGIAMDFWSLLRMEWVNSVQFLG